MIRGACTHCGCSYSECECSPQLTYEERATAIVRQLNNNPNIELGDRKYSASIILAYLRILENERK